MLRGWNSAILYLQLYGRTETPKSQHDMGPRIQRKYSLRLVLYAAGKQAARSFPEQPEKNAGRPG